MSTSCFGCQCTSRIAYEVARCLPDSETIISEHSGWHSHTYRQWVRGAAPWTLSNEHNSKCLSVGHRLLGLTTDTFISEKCTLLINEWNECKHRENRNVTICIPLFMMYAVFYFKPWVKLTLSLRSWIKYLHPLNINVEIWYRSVDCVTHNAFNFLLGEISNHNHIIWVVLCCFLLVFDYIYWHFSV